MVDYTFCQVLRFIRIDEVDFLRRMSLQLLWAVVFLHICCTYMAFSQESMVDTMDAVIIQADEQRRAVFSMTWFGNEAAACTGWPSFTGWLSNVSLQKASQMQNLCFIFYYLATDWRKKRKLIYRAAQKQPLLVWNVPFRWRLTYHIGNLQSGDIKCIILKEVILPNECFWCFKYVFGASK